MADPKTNGRMINKDISDSDGFASLTPNAAVLFCMLIPHFNSYGKMNGGGGYVKDEICPKIRYLTADNIPRYLKEISEKTNVKYFKKSGRWWLHAINFLTEHQRLRLDKMGANLLPDYPKPKSEISPGLSEKKIQQLQTDNPSPGLSPGPSPVLSPDLVRNEEEVEVEVEEEVQGEVQEEGLVPDLVPDLSQTALKPEPKRPLRKNIYDEEWLTEIKKNPAYRGIDVEREKAKMEAWCFTKGLTPSRGRLINWLNKVDKPLYPSKNPGMTASKGAAAILNKIDSLRKESQDV